MSSFWKDTARDVRLMKRGWRWGHRAQVPRSAEPFVPPATTTVFDNEWSRRPAARAVREVAQAGLEAVFRSQVKTQVEGLDVLDRLDGPVIFVANHASHLDTPLILLSLPDEWRRRTAVAAAADYFFDTWWRAVGSAIVFNTFPIDRRGGSMATTPGEVLDEMMAGGQGWDCPAGFLDKWEHAFVTWAEEAGYPLDYLTDGRQLVRATAYAPITDDPMTRFETQRFVAPVINQGYKIVSTPWKRFADGGMKANFDIELAVDILTMADRLDVVVLLSGDGDFRSFI